MFKQRCYQKELLDEENIPVVDLHRNLYELEVINRWLGGHAISISGIKKVVKLLNQQTISILDIGCGGGDNLRALNDKLTKNINFIFLGADLKEDCIDYARNKSQNMSAKNIRFIQSDFREVLFPAPDVIHASLFFHHFSEVEIVNFLVAAHARGCYIVINDLERHWLAYYAIKWITKLFSKSYLVKNDAPLSVMRGFKKIEWKAILASAGISSYTIHNKWAFRHLIITHPDAR